MSNDLATRLHNAGVRIEALSESLLMIRLGDVIEVDCNARVHALAARIDAAAMPGVIDLIPAYASLGVRYDPAVWAGSTSEPQNPLAAALAPLIVAVDIDEKSARSVDIAVCYGGAEGTDLDAVAAACGLTSDEVIARHLAPCYRVAMLGFAPGFPYLLGLDPALQLPRRDTPRLQVPSGSVAIGGAQTGIYPRALPGGWHLIGRTPQRLFDASALSPCLLAPGDRVRFRRIDAAEFATWPDMRR